MSPPRTHPTAPPLFPSSKQSVRGINTNLPTSRPHLHEHTRSADSPSDLFSPDSGRQSHGDVFSQIQPEGEGDADFGDHARPEELSNAFMPFFTLIEDANSSQYHHPTVHYIFSDDDPDLVTEAALRALRLSDDSISGPKAKTQQQHQNIAGDGGDPGHDNLIPKDPILPPPVPGVKERYIILDVEPSDWRQPGGAHGPSSVPSDVQTVIANSPIQYTQNFQHHRAGSRSSLSRPPTISTSSPYTITAAHSLHPDWQVLSTSISQAPSFHTFNNNNSSNNNQPSSTSTITLAPVQTPALPSETTTAITGGTTSYPSNIVTESQKNPRFSSANATQNPNPENEPTLLLRIEGTPGFPHVSPFSREHRERDPTSDTSHVNKQSLEEMMDQFEKRMQELRRVIEAGGIEPRQTPGVETGIELGTGTTPTIIRTKATNDGLEEMIHDQNKEDERGHSEVIDE